MPIFKRKSRNESSDLGQILLQGHDMIAQTARSHHEQWGFGSAERFEFDGDAGVLRWIFADHLAEAPVQILGSYSPSTRSWLWAWANESLPEHLRVDSASVRSWGMEHEQPVLIRPAVDDLGEEQAADLAAIAFRLTGATGFYRAPSSGPVAFMSFGTVTLVGRDGSRRSVTISTRS
jgi:hypothetical protein